MSHKLSNFSLPSVPWYEDAVPRRELPALALAALPWFSTAPFDGGNSPSIPATVVELPTAPLSFPQSVPSPWPAEPNPIPENSQNTAASQNNDSSHIDSLCKKHPRTKKLVPVHTKKRYSKPTPRPSLQDFFNYMQAFQGAHNASNPTLIVQLIRARCDLNFEHTSYRIDPDTKMVDEATRIRNVGLKAYLDYLQRLSKFVIDGVTTVGKPEYVTATAFANKVYIVSFPYVYKGTLVLCDPATVAEARSPDKVSPNNEEIPSTNDSTKTSANEDVDYTQLFLQESEILPIDEEEFCYDDDIELETCGISNENTSEPSMSFGGCAEDSPDERMAAEPVTRRENFLLMTFEEIADKAAIFFTADQKEVPSESKQDQSVLDSGNASTTCSSSSSSSSSSACSASPKEEHDAKAENKAVEVPTTQLEIKGDLKVYVLFSNHKIVKMEYMYQ